MSLTKGTLDRTLLTVPGFGKVEADCADGPHRSLFRWVNTSGATQDVAATYSGVAPSFGPFTNNGENESAPQAGTEDADTGTYQVGQGTGATGAVGGPEAATITVTSVNKPLGASDTCRFQAQAVAQDSPLLSIFFP